MVVIKIQNLDLEYKVYSDILLNKPEGDMGRKYLQFRNIKKSTAVKWKMGYCPVGYVPPIYEHIANNPQQYNFWEKMWGRVVFPILDSNGNVISISGRKIVEIPEKEKNPKYDHYSFNARKHLFGLWENQENIFIENKGIITEGQLDVITAWQKGVKIVTSSFGAHCSENHFILLSRFTDNINVLYDGDDAGKKGIALAKKILNKSNLNINCRCPFYGGDDLDSWLQKHSKEEFYKLIENNKMSYLMKKLKKIKGE